ncbi:MAG: alpha/beta hydrolase [Planctomycetota bacterium]
MNTATRRVWKVGRLILLAYGVVLVLLFSFQRTLMYPGRMTQGDPRAVVSERAGLELIDLGDAVAAFLPADRADAPTLIMFYGNGDSLKNFLPFGEGMRDRGMNVAVMEYPGYGMSSGSMSEANAFGAASQLYTLVASREGVDPNKIVALGVSLGGGSAVHVAEKHPVAGLVTMSTFTSMRSMAVRAIKIIPPILVLDDYDNLARLPDIEVPMYIVHGTDDELIPYSMSLDLADAAGGVVTHVPIDGAGHNDLFQVGGAAMWDDIADWCHSVTADTGEQ